MSDLILAIFRSETAAFVAGEKLAVLQQQAGTEPEDIVVITRDATGGISVTQSVDVATGRALGGGLWGALIGMLFLDKRRPVTGGKGLSSQFRTAGLDAAFLQDVAASLDAGGAALALRVRLLGARRVRDWFAALPEKPRVLSTRLSAEAEEALIDMQAQIPAQVPLAGPLYGAD